MIDRLGVRLQPVSVEVIESGFDNRRDFVGRLSLVVEQIPALVEIQFSVLVSYPEEHLVLVGGVDLFGSFDLNNK